MGHKNNRKWSFGRKKLGGALFVYIPSVPRPGIPGIIPGIPGKVKVTAQAKTGL